MPSSVDGVPTLRRPQVVRYPAVKDFPVQRNRGVPQPELHGKAARISALPSVRSARCRYGSRCSRDQPEQALYRVQQISWDRNRRIYPQLRIDRAKELLRDTDKSITEIAADVGFDDYNYFCRVFKKSADIRRRNTGSYSMRHRICPDPVYRTLQGIKVIDKSISKTVKSSNYFHLSIKELSSGTKFQKRVLPHLIYPALL